MKTKFLSRLRELRGTMSQEQFSNLIGAKQTSYSSWERGIKEPSISVLLKIASTMGVSSDWLLGLSERREPVGDVAPIALKPNRHQPTFMPRLDVLTEIASMKRRMQQLEAAAVQYLNDSASSSCCG